MTSDAENLWAKSVRALQRLKGQHPITRAEADEILSKAEEYPATDEEIEAVVRRVVAGTSPSPKVEPDTSWMTGDEIDEVEEDLLVLNRNAREGDTETDETIEQLRKELLGEGDDDEHQDGTDDGDGPSAQGG